MNHRFALASTGVAALALIAGCSSSGGSGSSTTDSVGGSTTVSVRSAGDAQILVDGSGRTLYFSDQERDAHKVLCSSSACTGIWMPLTVSGDAQPTGPADVSADLGTIATPNGARQVTFHGAPLYTFALDDAAGDVDGNGKQDSFDGTDFTWDAATVSGTLAAPSPTDSDDSGYGGY